MHRVNLLPLAASQRFARKRSLKAWGKFLLLGWLLAAIVIAWGQSTVASIRQQMTTHAAANQYPSSLRAQHASLAAQLQALNHYQQQQIELRSRYSPLVVIQLLHQLKEELGGQLHADAIEFVEQASTGTVPEQAVHGHTALQLVASGSNACSELMQRLRDSSLFSEVKLSSALELVDPQSDALRFTVRCEF